MAPAVSMKLEGFNELNAKLEKLSQKVGKKVVKKAVREAAKPTLKAIRSNAKSMIGGSMGVLIAKKATVKNFRHQRKGSFGVQIGMKPDVPEFVHYPVGASSTGKTSYIPAALEYGHDNAAPIPYIRRAWDSTKAKVAAVLREHLKNGIDAAMK